MRNYSQPTASLEPQLERHRQLQDSDLHVHLAVIALTIVGDVRHICPAFSHKFPVLSRDCYPLSTGQSQFSIGEHS